MSMQNSGRSKPVMVWCAPVSGELIPDLAERVDGDIRLRKLAEFG